MSDTAYLESCLEGVASRLGLTPADLRSGADAKAREGRAIAAWFARGKVDVHQTGWDIIAAAYGYAKPMEAIQAVERVEKGQATLLDRCSMAVAIAIRIHAHAAYPPKRHTTDKRPAEGDSEAPRPTPAWDPEQDGCEDADDLELPFPDWLQDPEEEPGA